jgi:hypothetical protein
MFRDRAWGIISFVSSDLAWCLKNVLMASRARAQMYKRNKTAVVRQKSKLPIKALISNLLKAVDRVSMRL